MSVLTGPEIRELAFGSTGPSGERLKITPFDSRLCGPNSYDVHLGDLLRVYDLAAGEPFDPEAPPPTIPVYPGPDGRWLLQPHVGYLGFIRERIECHGLVPYLDGRSSTGRCFVTLHQTAGAGDDGWGGHFTAEIVVTFGNPVYLRPGQRVGQIRFHTIVGDRAPYAGRYQDQPAEPVGTRFHLKETA